MLILPASLAAEIDRYERNRSRFIAEPVRQELAEAAVRRCFSRLSIHIHGASLMLSSV
jgi:hypothetical protein